MANTYHQLGVHIVTAPKYRQGLILDAWRDELEAVVCAEVIKRGHGAIACRAQPDHIHLFADLLPRDCVSDLTGTWKAISSGWIRSKYNPEFEWQRGYGAFSVSKSAWPATKRYVENQDEHHRGQGFREEYLGMLRREGIDYDEAYLFDFAT